MNYLSQTTKPDFQIILPEHAELFEEDVFNAYDNALFKRKEIAHGIPTVLGIFCSYETFANPTPYGAALLNIEHDSSDYYRKLKESTSDKILMLMVNSAVMDKQKQEKVDHYDQMLCNDVAEVLKNHNMCHAELYHIDRRERNPDIHYRNLPTINIW